MPLSRVNLDVRIVFNPNVTTAWFTSVTAVINHVTMLARHFHLPWGSTHHQCWPQLNDGKATRLCFTKKALAEFELRVKQKLPVSAQAI